MAEVDYWGRRNLRRVWVGNAELRWGVPKAMEGTWKRLYSIVSNEQRFPLQPDIITSGVYPSICFPF